MAEPAVFDCVIECAMEPKPGFRLTIDGVESSVLIVEPLPDGKWKVVAVEILQ